MKKTLKLAILLSIVLCVSTIAGYCALKYFHPGGNSIGETARIRNEEENTVSAVSASAIPDKNSEEKPIEFDYYVARLDGNVLNIYISDNGREEFLYSIDIYVKNIPYDDAKLLSKGVKLYSKQELTRFEEDFTS